MRLRLQVEGCSTGSQSVVTDQSVRNADSYCTFRLSVRNSGTGDLAICVLTGSPGFPYTLSFEKQCVMINQKSCLSGLEEIKTVTQ